MYSHARYLKAKHLKAAANFGHKLCLDVVAAHRSNQKTNMQKEKRNNWKDEELESRRERKIAMKVSESH